MKHVVLVGASLAIAASAFGCGGDNEGFEERNQESPATTDKEGEERTCKPVVPPGCMEALCDAAKCGDPESVYDADGCFRRACSVQDECEEGEECRERSYYKFIFSGVSEEHPICEAGMWDALFTHSFCMPVAQ